MPADRPRRLAPRLHVLRTVLRYARPYRRTTALALALMALASFLAAGRIVLFYPVFTRVIPADAVAAPPGAAASEEDEAQRLVEKATRGGGLQRAFDALLDAANARTAALVPDAWVEDAGRSEHDPAAREAARARARDRFATLWTLCIVFVVFIVGMCAAAYLESYLIGRVNLSMVMDVREAVSRRLLDQPVAFYDQRRRGELVQRVLVDVAGYAQWLTLFFTAVLKGAVQILGGLGAMLLVSWHLTLVCLIGVPFLLPMRRLTARTLKRSHRRQHEASRLTEATLQVFSGIRTVKAYGTEARRVRELRAADEEVTRQGLKVQRAKSAADALTEFINNFLALALAVGGGWLLLRGVVPVDAGRLAIFLALALNLYHPIKRFVKAYNQMTEAQASVERTVEYLKLPEGMPDTPGAVDFPGIRETIRFEGVGFSYTEGRPVVEDVDLELPRGSTVALVGPSGAGKSTLCDLLLRFHDPERGRITVDGTDVRAFRRSSYLARTAIVTQSPFLFHASIRENIRQGKPDATDAEVEAAARAAQIHDHIVTLPRGYDEEVGELGVRLSGGQRQRITIARALVRDPEILVLDEATASLDTASERAVQEALERLRAGRTTLVVAHRLSTVQGADRIVVLDGGRVVATGTHRELLDRPGLYAELVRLQNLA